MAKEDGKINVQITDRNPADLWKKIREIWSVNNRSQLALITDIDIDQGTGIGTVILNDRIIELLPIALKDEEGNIRRDEDGKELYEIVEIKPELQESQKREIIWNMVMSFLPSLPYVTILENLRSQ